MILNAAVLIGRSEEAQFDQAIEQLNRGYGDRLDFRCVGPLPPYSSVSRMDRCPKVFN